MTEENGLEKIYSDGYNELKNDLKERYTAKVYAALKDVRETLVNRASAIFGDEFFSLLNESLLLETEKEKARRDFFSETDYETAQKELKSLRKKQQDEGGSEETNKALGLDEPSQDATEDASRSAISSKKPKLMLAQSARAVQP